MVLVAIGGALFLAGCIVLAVTARWIWNDLNPILQYKLLMQRTSLRLEIEEFGYEFPEWLEDEDAEQPEGEVLRLVPKER